MVSNTSLTWQLELTEEHGSYLRLRCFFQKDTELCGSWGPKNVAFLRDRFLVFLKPLAPQLAAVPGMIERMKQDQLACRIHEVKPPS